MKRKLVAIALVMLMLFGLCACDENSQSGNAGGGADNNNNNVDKYANLTPYETLFANVGLCVQDENGLWGYINKDGDYVIEPQFADAFTFDEKEELAKVQSAENGLYGYINNKGEYVVEPQFADAFTFDEKEELARVQSADNGLYGYINNKGEYVVEPQFTEAYVIFNEGLTCVKSAENGLWGFINNKGEYVIQPQFIQAHNFIDGLAIVTTEDGVQYIDTSGKQAFGRTYEEAYEFSEDMAVVMQNGLYGYINRQGEMVIEPQFVEVSAFDNGVAFVQNDPSYNIYTLIDKEGNILTDAKVEKGSYSTAYSTQKERPHNADGLYAVLISDYEYIGAQAYVISKYYFINNKGEIVLPKADSGQASYYKNARYFEDGYAIVQDNMTDLWGVIDVDGNWVVSPQLSQSMEVEYSSEEIICLAHYKSINSERYIDYYCFDKQGNRVKENHLQGYDYISYADYEKNFMCLKMRQETGYSCQFADFDGNLLVDYTFEDTAGWRLNDTGLDCAIVKYNGLYGIIDGGGNWLIEPKFQNVHQ